MPKMIFKQQEIYDRRDWDQREDEEGEKILYPQDPDIEYTCIVWTKPPKGSLREAMFSNRALATFVPLPERWIQGYACALE